MDKRLIQMEQNEAKCKSKAKDLETKLIELFCIINGDGGQRFQKLGFEKAYKDVIAKIYRMKAKEGEIPIMDCSWCDQAITPGDEVYCEDCGEVFCGEICVEEHTCTNNEEVMGEDVPFIEE